MLVCVRHVSSREIAASAVSRTVAIRFWYLPLGVVLKREMKGIWWMPWH